MHDDVDEGMVDSVTQLLGDAAGLPWKTARYLARRLSELQNVRVSPDALEEALLEHAASKERRIRYSFFPARKTLDLLWGHVDNVGETGELPSVLLRPDAEIAALVGESSSPNLSADAPWCFLSHSFRDLETVLGLRGEIVRRGYGVWLAEVEIEAGVMITQAVQRGLRSSDKLVALMTPRSIGSRWVLKEINVAINAMRLPPVVIVDGSSDELVELFGAWIAGAEGWGDQVAASVERLVSRDHDEPAATDLPTLVLDGLGDIPLGNRRAVIWPATAIASKQPFLTMDQAFEPLV